METVKEILEEILNSIKEALEHRDLLYIFIILLMIFSFTAGVIFALGMLLFVIYFFATIFKGALNGFAISMIKLTNGNKRKEVQNENKDMEKR
jgi:fatty acid desaturase